MGLYAFVCWAIAGAYGVYPYGYTDSGDSIVNRDGYYYMLELSIYLDTDFSNNSTLLAKGL